MGVTEKPDDVPLDTNRLSYREWDDGDLDRFHANGTDPQVMQFVGAGETWSKDLATAIMEFIMVSIDFHIRRATILAFTCFLAFSLASTPPSKADVLAPADKSKANEPQLTLGKPVVVATSNVGEARWGHHQFPKLSPLPGGAILLTFNSTADDNAAYGKPGPAFVSHDRGQTWKPFRGKETAIAISHSPITAVLNGEFLCVPFPPGLDVKQMGGMPKPAGNYFCYAKRNYFRFDECPDSVKQYVTGIRGYRWTPTTTTWNVEPIRYDMRNALIWTSEQSNGSILSRTSFEYPVLVAGHELFVADYKFRYLHRDGSVPKGMVVTCMASTDNGRTFQRRSEIAFDPTGTEMPSETAMALTSDNQLLCIGRSTDHRQRPMWITHSADRGRTWSKRTPVMPFGVMPQLLTLDNSVLVLTFGRPGVHLSFSTDGTGRTWTKPTAIITGDARKVTQHSCGYTSLLKLPGNQCLMAYSDFQHQDSDGKQRKAILVRTVAIGRRR